MKTRIFTTAAMILLTTGFVEGAFHQNAKDSTTVLAYVPAEKKHSAPVSGLSVHNTMENNTFVLENWIAGREAWEKGSDTYSNYLTETVRLKEWIAGRENWEQKESDEEIPGFTKGSDILGKWIAERENWEQK